MCMSIFHFHSLKPRKLLNFCLTHLKFSVKYKFKISFCSKTSEMIFMMSIHETVVAYSKN